MSKNTEENINRSMDQNIEKISEKYMERAIELAKKGEGAVNPNPLVGAVIVKNGKIIGEGYHQKYGEFHAERNAFASLKESAEGATLYVTLSPCCHHGKQPPCTDAIIENKIKKVVIGSFDPNPLVGKKSVETLRKAGIEVVEGFLKEECDSLNDVFFKYITKKRPYVVMKYAMTLDGKIATKTGESKWISGEESRAYVHKLRNKYKGIMVGIGTVLADNPTLNCRLKNQKVRNPIRIICDSKLQIPLDCNIVKTAKEQETIIAFANDKLPEGWIVNKKNEENKGENKEKIIKEKIIKEKISSLQEKGIRLINLFSEKGKIDLVKLMQYLADDGIDGILLEGGGTLNDSAMASNIVDEIVAFVAPKIFGGKSLSPVSGEGVEKVSQAYSLELKEIQQVGEDLKISYKVKNNM